MTARQRSARMEWHPPPDEPPAPSGPDELPGAEPETPPDPPSELPEPPSEQPPTPPPETDPQVG